MLLSALSLIGVVAHASTRIRLPLEEWSYLATGATGLLTLLVYESFATYVELNTRVTFGLFLVSGVVSAYAAHLIDGGKREGRGDR